MGSLGVGRVRLANLVRFRYVLGQWRNPAEFLAAYGEWTDTMLGTYKHAHGAFYNVGTSHLYPPEADPCWCSIGKDHDAA